MIIEGNWCSKINESLNSLGVKNLEFKNNCSNEILDSNEIFHWINTLKRKN